MKKFLVFIFIMAVFLFTAPNAKATGYEVVIHNIDSFFDVYYALGDLETPNYLGLSGAVTGYYDTTEVPEGTTVDFYVSGPLGVYVEGIPVASIPADNFPLGSVPSEDFPSPWDYNGHYEYAFTAADIGLPDDDFYGNVMADLFFSEWTGPFSINVALNLYSPFYEEAFGSLQTAVLFLTMIEGALYEEIGIPMDNHVLVTAGAPVPVPGALWLLGTGLAGLLGLRRKIFRT